jgi:enamine deaminase RidA (YjgF/YER057c/UK114 family)
MPNFKLFCVGIVCSLSLSGCVLSVSDSPDRSQSYQQKQTIERKYYGEWEAEYGYTQVVKVGNTLHISGITGQGETMEEQIHSVYTYLNRILTDYGVTSDNIVKETIFTTDMRAMADAQGVRLEYYNKDKYPSSTWVEVKGLYLPSIMLEVETTVIID